MLGLSKPRQVNPWGEEYGDDDKTEARRYDKSPHQPGRGDVWPSLSVLVSSVCPEEEDSTVNDIRQRRHGSPFYPASHSHLTSPYLEIGWG